MTEALITGATGFVGRHLVEALQARGYGVRALALPSEDTNALERAGVRIFRGDVQSAETLIRPTQGVDTVYHLAAIHGLWRPQQEYYSVNVAGAENVCRAALAAGVRRLIHVSSWAVYGMALGQPAREDFPLKPIDDPYAVTKAEADRRVRKYVAEDHLPAVIVRPGTMFGPGDQVNFGRMADRLSAGKVVIIGSGRNLLPFVYVTDVVDGMLLAAEKKEAAGEIYNLSTDRPLTQKQLWEAIAQEIGVAPPRLRVPYHALLALAYMAERGFKPDDQVQRQPLVTRLGVKLFGSGNEHAIDKARRELGYAPKISVREGVRLAANWYVHRRAPAGEKSSSQPEHPSRPA